MSRWSIILIAVSPVTIGLCQSQTPLAVISEINLRDFGSTGTPPGPRQPHRPYRNLFTFTPHGDLITAWLVRERNGLLTRDLPPYDLRLSLIDIHKRVAKSHASLPTTRFGGNDVYSTADDTIVVYAGDHLHLLSSDLQRQEPRDADSIYVTPVLESHDKKTVLVRSPNSSKDGEIIQSLDPRTLKPLRSCNYLGSVGRVENVSDNGDTVTVMSRFKQSIVTSEHLCGEPSIIESSTEYVRSVFLRPDMLFFTGLNRFFRVITTSGKLLFADKYGRDDIVDSYVRVSLDSKYFAISVVTIKGRNDLFDIGGHVGIQRVVIYDLIDGKRVAEIKLPTVPKWYFDFSPDGQIFTVRSDSIIRFYGFR